MPNKFFQGTLSKESESLKEGTKAEKSGIFSKQRAALADSLHLKRPASSVEADIAGTSNSRSLPKQEASTASSKAYSFKEGRIFLILLFRYSFCIFCFSLLYYF